MLDMPFNMQGSWYIDYIQIKHVDVDHMSRVKHVLVDKRNLLCVSYSICIENERSYVEMYYCYKYNCNCSCGLIRKDEG